MGKRKLIPRTELVRITPTTAAKLLETNTQNRGLRQPCVDRYAGAMKRGEWRWDNGESVKVDVNGNLLDGQHRLWAVLEANRPVKLLVTYDVAIDAFKTMDQGMSRSVADVLKISGESGSKLLSSTLALIWRYQDGTLRWSTKPTYEQLKEVLDEHPKVRMSVGAVGKHKTPRGFVSKSNLAFVHYGISRNSPEAADVFVDHVCEEGGLDKGHPVIILRKRLTTARDSRIKMRRVEQLAIIVKAWNAVIKKKKVKALKWGVNTGEAFPDIVGW